jgi:hypothetical protein
MKLAIGVPPTILGITRIVFAAVGSYPRGGMLCSRFGIDSLLTARFILTVVCMGHIMFGSLTRTGWFVVLRG